MDFKKLLFIPVISLLLVGCGEEKPHGTPSGKTDQEIVDEVSRVWANATIFITYQQSKGTKTVSSFLIEESVTENNMNLIFKPADYPAPLGSITATAIYVNAWFMLSSDEPDRVVTIDWEIDRNYFNYQKTSSDEISQDAIRPIKSAFPPVGESIFTDFRATFTLNEATKVNVYHIELQTIDHGS